MEIEALKRGSDGGASVGDGGQVTADWAAALKEQTEALKEALSARGGQNSITSVKTDFVWPTLTDDKSDAKDVVLFYEEFEDVCALANNCRGMSARERLLALRARCKGSRQKTYTNAYRAAWKSGEVISDPEAVYLRIKNKHLREVRVDGEHQALTKGKLTGHQFEPLFEASIADLEAVGLGKTPRELYLSYLRKMPPHLQKEIRQDKRIWPGDGKDVGLRSPATWEESHKLVLEYEQREATEEEEEEDARARKEEAELRREGHLRGTTSRTTSPTSSRKRTGQEDHRGTGRVLRQRTVRKAIGSRGGLRGLPGERERVLHAKLHRTNKGRLPLGRRRRRRRRRKEGNQSHSRSKRRTHRGRAGRGEKEEDQGDQPQDQGASKGEGKGDGRIRVPARLHEGVEGVLRRWSDLQAALRDQGKDLGRPRLDLQAPERRKRQERKRKGQGRRRKGKISSGFVPRDEEDRKYWEEMDRQSEEQKKKKEAAAGKKKQEE